jgi:hypothetical protein
MNAHHQLRAPSKSATLSRDQSECLSLSERNYCRKSGGADSRAAGPVDRSGAGIKN